MMEKLLIVLLGVASYTSASKMCAGDDDCADLGDVFCMKSRCDWGLCGCPRGQAMRFLGSEKKFQCVPIRRVGESCSTDGDAGVCGAEKSRCIDGSCQCEKSSGLYSYWGGELCEEQSHSVSGETCSTSLGTCGRLSGNPPGSGTNSFGCRESGDWWDGPLQSLPNTCSCSDGYRVALENDFDDHEFTGKTIPRCVPIKHGELCLRNLDCQGSGMECSIDQKCACVLATEVPDIDGTSCNAPLAKGTQCKGTGYIPGSGHCDGTKGLVCGDVCEVATYNTGNRENCVCDKSYTDTSPSCGKREVGSSCDRDYECKSASRTGVCVDGLCKAGAGMMIGSIFTILVSVMFTLQGIA